MRLFRLAGVVLAAAVPSWGQVVEHTPSEPRAPEEASFKKLPSKTGGATKSIPLDEDAAAAAVLKKKFLYCKKTGDCKPYLLEKEKYKQDKPNKLEPVDVSPETPSLPPAPAAGRSRGAAPSGGAIPGVPREVQPSLAGDPMGEASTVPPPSAERTEAMRQEAGQRRELTWSRAAGAADTMRRDFLPADETAGPKPGGPPADEDRAASPPDAPWTVPEMALAASKGYAATFRDQGLKVGAGPRGEPAILRADGAAASPSDLARLRTALSSDPAAMRRRPDFFEVLPREKFADLKQDFAARPELRATVFRDIAMTARERDFQWSASCSSLSGGCNPLAGQGSYRKGQDVAPEDLDAAWNAAQEDIFDADEDDGWGEYTEEERRLAAEADLAEKMLGAGRARGPALGTLLSRMGELARDVRDAAGWAPAAAGERADARGGLDGPVVEGEPVHAASGEGAAATARPAVVLPGPPPVPEGRAAGRGWLYVLAAAAGAAGLLVVGLRRRTGG